MEHQVNDAVQAIREGGDFKDLDMGPFLVNHDGITIWITTPGGHDRVIFFAVVSEGARWHYRVVLGEKVIMSKASVHVGKLRPEIAFRRVRRAILAEFGWTLDNLNKRWGGEDEENHA